MGQVDWRMLFCPWDLCPLSSWLCTYHLTQRSTARMWPTAGITLLILQSSGGAAGLFTEKKVNGPEQRGGGGRKCTRDRAEAQCDLTWDSRLRWAPTQRKEAKGGLSHCYREGSDCPIITKSPRERLGRARTPGPASQVCLCHSAPTAPRRGTRSEGGVQGY